MNNYQQIKTKKLFYGKWPYKIATYCQGSHKLKHYKNEPNILSTFTVIQGLNQGQRQRLLDFFKRINSLSNENIAVRSESGHYNIFVDNRDLFNKIVKIMYPFISSTTEPENDDILEFLQQNNKINVVDSLPYGKFSVKVTFKELSDQDKIVLLKLIKTLPTDHYSLSKTTFLYLNNEVRWMQNPFMYAKDDKTLSFLALIANNSIKKLERFVLKSSINTCQGREQLCQL